MFKQFDVTKMIKENKAAVIVSIVFSFIIGIMCLIAPFAFGGVLAWIIIILAGIAGVLSIVKFIVPGKGNERKGSSLVLGIIAVICVVGLILIACLGKSQVIKGETYSSMEITTIRILGFSSVFFGVMAIINNIFLLCTVGNIQSDAKGIVIAKAIFGLIIGILMVIFPFVMFTISVIIGGVYLIIAAIYLIVVLAKLSKDTKTDK